MNASDYANVHDKSATTNLQ